MRLADQLDRLLTSDPPDDPAAVRAVAEGPDVAALGLGPEVIVDAWSLLYLARAEAIDVFG